jgi:hypothetical protein
MFFLQRNEDNLDISLSVQNQYNGHPTQNTSHPTYEMSDQVRMMDS